MTIIPQDVLDDGSFYLKSCIINRVDHSGESDEKKLWFKVPNTLPKPKKNDCEPFLLAMIMDAMAEGREIIVKGTISLELLSNLTEYQLAWNKWLPDLYSRIQIKVDSIIRGESTNDGAICAFSGGVDATHSVWRHIKQKIGYRSQSIKLCVIVHGFDIPLSDTTAFENAKHRARKTLSSLDIPLEPIQTNFRKISNVNWEHSFACALVATLNNLKSVAGSCIVGSSEPYDSLVIPWGSSPITDHLLSSQSFRVLHDGADRSRSQKVFDILEWQEGIANLRVCWQGNIKDENCGTCEKCLRTQLNFLVNKTEIPSSFPNIQIEYYLRNVNISNDAVKKEWLLIYKQAKKECINEPWVDLVRKAIHKKPLNLIIFPENSYRRYIVKKALNIYRRLKS